jgi:hypothetical protein
MGCYILVYNFFYKTSLARFQAITEYLKNKDKNIIPSTNLLKNKV